MSHPPPSGRLEGAFIRVVVDDGQPHQSDSNAAGMLGVMRLSLEKRAWYIDKFGMERECVVVTASGFGMSRDPFLVVGLGGEPLKDVKPEDVYYVPVNAPD